MHDPVEGATVSTPTGDTAITDAAGDFMLDSVPRSFLSVEPPAGANLLEGGTRYSVSPGESVDIELSGADPEMTQLTCRTTSASLVMVP